MSKNCADILELPNNWVKTFVEQILTPSDTKVVPSSKMVTPFIGLEHIEKTTGKLVGQGISSDVKSSKSVFKLEPFSMGVIVNSCV